MKKLRIWASVSLTLGILGIVVFVPMLLALVDISKGQENVAGEWLMVKLGLLILFFVTVVTFVFTGLVLKHFREKNGGPGPKEMP
jgi:heme/copper-type cytochrome/quinol oxidase subunit 2